MGRGFRKERVATAIRRIVCETIAHGLNDPRVPPMTTITRVEMSDDLMVARTYFSVQGGEAVERNTLRAIRSATGFIQRRVAQQLALRQCPELRFDLDERAKYVRNTMELLANNLLGDPTLADPPEDVEAKPAPPDSGTTDKEPEDGG